MTATITIRVEDTHPRPNARPLDATKVEELAESMRLIGFSPAKPVEVRRDGDIYWIVDGGHRRAAAEVAGLTEIPAMVVELDEAGVLTHEGALNIQRPDTEEERWARAQQFLLLGKAATPKQIEVATGLAPDAQAKVHTVLKKLADPVAAEDVTLAQALAAHEFADDDEAFAKIMNAGANWESVHRDIDRLRKLDKAVAEATIIIEAAGCKVIETVDRSKLDWITQGETAPEGAQYGCINRSYANVWISWWKDAGEETVDPEEGARKEAEAKHEADLEAAQAKRVEFLRDHLTGNGTVVRNDTLKDFAQKAWEGDEDGGYPADVSDILDELAEVASFVPRVYAAILSAVEHNAAYLLTRPDYGYYLDQHGATTVAYFKALKGVGYEPSEVENAVLDEIVDALAGDGDE